jgi:hypothetical protein
MDSAVNRLTPLWLMLLAVLVTAFGIIARRRSTGVLLICAACLGLTSVIVDPLLGHYLFNTLTNRGWTFEAAHTAYMVITSSGPWSLGCSSGRR